MSRKRLASNFSANVFSQVANLLWQLGIIPLFLHQWDKVHYGEWILISAIPAYLSLGDAGLATVAANEVSMYVAMGRPEQAQRSLHSATGFLAVVSLLLLVASLVLSFTLPWNDYFHIRDASESSVRLSLFFLAVYTILILSYALYSAVYRAVFKAHRFVFLTSFARIAEIAVMAVAVSFSKSFVILAAALLSVRALTVVALHLDTLFLSDEITLGFKYFSFEEIKRTWKPSVLFMAFTIGNAFYFQGLTIVAGNILGPIALVLFNTTRALARAVVQIAAVLKQTVWPEFSYLIGRGELEKARQLNATALEATLLASTLLSGVLLVFGRTIMKLWTASAIAVDRKLLAILLLSAVLNSCWFVGTGLLMGANEHSRLGRWYVAGTAIAVASSIALAQLFGIYGLGWAMLLCEVIVAPVALFEISRVLKERPLLTITRLIKFNELLRVVRRKFEHPLTNNV